MRRSFLEETKHDSRVTIIVINDSKKLSIVCFKNEEGSIYDVVTLTTLYFFGILAIKKMDRKFVVN